MNVACVSSGQVTKDAGVPNVLQINTVVLLSFLWDWKSLDGLRIHIDIAIYLALSIYVCCAVHWCVALYVQAWQGGHATAALVGGRSQISASVRVLPSGM